MKHRFPVLAVAVALLLQPGAYAANLDRATITEVVKDVTVIDAPTKKSSPAQVRAVFATPNILRTGAESRAELVADDQTVTRVGANTLFSFEPKTREINLQRGSILFNSPTGKGGGTIKTAAATASVLGTTLIVSTTRSGGFKVLLLEGRGTVRLANGIARTLAAGQMTYVLPGERVGPVINFQLREQVGGSRLVSGFRQPLPSTPKIEAAIQRQQAQIEKGKLSKTGLLASDSPDVAYQVEPAAQQALLQDPAQPTEEEVVEAIKLSPFVLAFTSDAIIDTPELDATRLFSLGDPDVDFADPGSMLQGRNRVISGEQNIFLANNTLATASQIDLAPFANTGLFSFVSAGDFKIDGAVNITGGGTTPIDILIGGTFLNTPGSSLTVDSPALDIVTFGSSFEEGAAASGVVDTSSFAPLELSSFALNNTGGDIGIFAPSISFDAVAIHAAGAIGLFSSGDISLTGKVTAPTDVVAAAPTVNNATSNGVLSGQRIAVNAVGEVKGAGVDFIALNLTQIRGADIRLKLVRFRPPNLPSLQGGVDLRARQDIALLNGVFQVANVSMSARTIILENVFFRQGSKVVLSSQFGRLAPNPNTGRPPRPGLVNFIRNVRYGGSPAESAVGEAITIKRR